MSEHTDGPWIVPDDEPFEIATEELAGIGLVYNEPEELREEYKANARLIAAAPDLLEQLIDMTARFERCCEYNGNATPEMLAESVKGAKAAIAKARGEA